MKIHGHLHSMRKYKPEILGVIFHLATTSPIVIEKVAGNGLRLCAL